MCVCIFSLNCEVLLFFLCGIRLRGNDCFDAIVRRLVRRSVSEGGSFSEGGDETSRIDCVNWSKVVAPVIFAHVAQLV